MAHCEKTGGRRRERLVAPRFLQMVLVAAAPLVAQAVAAPPGVDFQRDIRPILSDNCFRCHGPDPDTRMAGLRLDTREGAMAERKAGRPVAPGQPQASLLYQRISQAKEALRMPPPFAHKTLTDTQKETLRRWIEQGAPWKEHWAFAVPVRPALPEDPKSWARNPIDRFVLARLQAAGIEPNPEADRRTLIRRLSFDLTGLPPEPADVEAFVRDKAADAYERLVDHLLASPHYGEHRARYWLDAARYADTNGLHFDNYREMWPYRDWVIQAFNRNMPFDRFTLEQVAGDLLPNATFEQRVASGFNRCNVTTNEAGSIPEEVEAIYAKDRVETTATVWLGLTVGCASCHDHKFDPIPQKDFYRLAAFFRNTTQGPMDGNVPDTPPVLLMPRAEDEARFRDLQNEETVLRKQLKERRGAALPDMEPWLAHVERGSMVMPSGGASELLRIFALDRLDLPGGVNIGEGPAKNWQALHFSSGPGVRAPAGDLLDAGKTFTISTWFFRPDKDDNFFLAGQFKSTASSMQEAAPDQSRGWILELIAGRVISLSLAAGRSGWIETSGSVAQNVKPASWGHLSITYDGSRRPTGFTIFVNGKPLAVDNRGIAAIDKDGDLRTGLPLQLGGDGKKGAFPGGALGDFRIHARVLGQDEIATMASWPRIESALAAPAGGMSPAARDSLREYYLSHEDETYLGLTRRLAAIENDLRSIRDRASTAEVMMEKTDSKPVAQILFRGQYDQPKETVQPGVPTALPQMPDSLPRNRLGLARWLMDPVNPLTVRVTVNRFWQELFGSGLVRTSEDFGAQGEPPSHPELLDWLAVEFRESRWDVKKILRLMVMSAAYRQSAAADDEKLRIDPDNRLLSRGPRFRLDGEAVRDLALASSGLLSPAIGGPSVRPYQPDGIWQAVAMPRSNTRYYRQEHGDDLYRRSLYTFWKRSAPPASMDIFNAPSRESCTVRRERTNTPLQALVVLDDPQFVEASRYLAGRALRSAPRSFNGRLDFITMRVLSRPFQPRERAIVRRSLQDLEAYYRAHAASAAKLVAVGEAEADPNLSKPEFAAWTMVASQVMNLDEALNK